MKCVFLKSMVALVAVQIWLGAFAQRLPNLIPFRKGDKWGYVDSTKKIILPVKFILATPFTEGYAVVQRPGAKKSFIDATGKEFISTTYSIDRGFAEGMAGIERNGKHGAVDKTFREVIAPKYDYDFFFEGGLAKVQLNGKYGYVDSTGKEVVSPKYESLSEFRDGLAVFMFNNKLGFVDKTGNEVIESKYYNVSAFSNGLACVQLTESDKWGVISKRDREMMPFKYDVGGSIAADMFYLKINGEATMIVYKNGRRLADINYDDIFRFTIVKICEFCFRRIEINATIFHAIFTKNFCN